MKKTASPFKIIEEKNVIHDHLLDIIGSEFKFDHEKGIAEWLKNSVDAYIRSDVPDREQFIVLRFNEGEGEQRANFECIDFVGMTERDIVKALKKWGDPEAARRGLKKKTYGGHGNGGKFYMREMFEKSYFLTYKNGLLNIFGFNERKKYGFADNFRNKKVSPEEALRLAEIDESVIETDIIEKIIKKKTGFTLAKGFAPRGMKNKINALGLAEKFRNHPQSRYILSRANVSIFFNKVRLHERLMPSDIIPMKNFEVPRVFEIPKKIILDEHRSKKEIILSDNKFPPGKLILKTSDEAFNRNGRFENLNRIDFIGEVNVIGSYKIYELGVRNFPQASFIHGECTCPILEDPENDAVKNDRSKLVEEDERVKVLLKWVAEKIDYLASDIAAIEQKERERIKAEVSSVYNDFLNKWKNKFFDKTMSELFGEKIGSKGSGNEGKDPSNIVRKRLVAPDSLEFVYAAAKIPIGEIYPITLKARVSKVIPVGGIITFSSSNDSIAINKAKITIKSENIKKSFDEKDVAVINNFVIGKKIGEQGKIIATIGKHQAEIEIEVVKSDNREKPKKVAHPKVLLSNVDTDPLGLSTSGTVSLDARQPLVYQRPQDIKERIYWINTSSPIAKNIREIYNPHSLRWRDFLFQRYVDIFLKEALFELQRKDPESFRAERIDADIFGTLVTKIHAAASEDLHDFLFKEDYEPPEESRI